MIRRTNHTHSHQAIKSSPILAMIIPAYNESAVINTCVRELINVLDGLVATRSISPTSYLVFVDDGSTDTTWSLITRLRQQEQRIKALRLDKNYGQQTALMAGLSEFRDQADCFITLDADLQDDIRLIEQFIASYQKGFNVVLGIRNNRAADHWLKRTSAQWFYCLARLIDPTIVKNHGDFRLLSHEAVSRITYARQQQIVLRSLIPKLGLKTDYITYPRKKRQAGKSKYTVRKMLRLSFDIVRATFIRSTTRPSIYTIQESIE